MPCRTYNYTKDIKRILVTDLSEALLFKKNMVPPAGIFVEIESTSEFDGWSNQELISEINRLREILRVHDEVKKRREALEKTGGHELTSHFC